MEDIVTAAFDYDELDRAEHAVRIRLSTTAMRVSRVADGIEVVYLNQPGAAKVRAKHCVLACNNGMIPYLVRELPEEQKAALREAVRVPLVYTNVLLRNWSSFVQAGVHRVYCPGAHYQDVALDFPVSLGGYQFSGTFQDPIVVHMARAPAPGDGSRPRDQFRTGREELLNLPFETIERETRAQLTAMLSPHGFDPVRDILAITVNRWPHGYAYERIELFEARPAPGQATHEIARASFGPITIANSDAEGRAYVDAAFDAARRAVDQLV
jgi:spermidine dehydrogenase